MDGRAGKRRQRAHFLDRVARVFETDPATAEALLAQERKSSVRVNRLSDRGTDEIEGSLRAEGYAVEPIPWCADAFRLHDRKHELAGSPLFRDGHVYIQNASSLLPTLALDPRPGQSILDVCAAPGGKTAHIAAVTENEAEIWANDSIKPRVDKLREVLATFRVRPAAITEHPGQYIDKFVTRQFDAILLDAQCSGEGMLDLSRPDALRYWSLDRVTKFSWLQKRMLRAAFRLLRPGGTLVYSTCSISPEENEAVVDSLLRHHPDADIDPIEIDFEGRREGLTRWGDDPFDARLRGAARVKPSTFMEGFFVCRLRRVS